MTQKILLPLREIVELTYLTNERVFVNYTNTVPPKRTELMNIITAAVEDYIGDKSIRPTKYVSTLKDVMQENLPWFEEGDKFSDWWYAEIWDPIDLRLMEIISEAIPHKTWDVWSVERRGSDLILTNFGDFRILEWTKKTKSGEWR
jgi:hypothetical protein